MRAPAVAGASQSDACEGDAPAGPFHEVIDWYGSFPVEPGRLIGVENGLHRRQVISYRRSAFDAAAAVAATADEPRTDRLVVMNISLEYCAV